MTDLLGREPQESARRGNAGEGGNGSVATPHHVRPGRRRRDTTSAAGRHGAGRLLTSVPADLVRSCPGSGACAALGGPVRAPARSHAGRAPPLGLGPFFFNDTATTEIYTLSLHDALPI